MAIAGFGGQVRVSTTAAVDVTAWSLDIERDLMESTALNTSGGAKTIVPGTYGATGTIEANFNMSDTTGQKALHDAFFSASAVTLNLDTATSGSLRTYSGSAYLSKISTSVGVGDLVTISFDITFNGAVSFA